MIRTVTPILARSISKSALALALGLGIASGSMLAATPAMAAKKQQTGGKNSVEFIKAAQPIDAEVKAKLADPAVVAAADAGKGATGPARAAAIAKADAAAGGLRAKLDAMVPLATAPLDKVILGQWMQQYGGLLGDFAYQHQGLKMMLDSGGLDAATSPKVAYYAGVTAYQSENYASAVRYLQQAKAANFADGQGMLDKILADSLKRTGDTQGAMQLAMSEIATARAAGRMPSEGALRSALQAAYDAKQLSQSADLAAELATGYSSPAVWNTAISVIRSLTQLGPQENLDLMRLMARTNSWSDKRDFLAYIEDADVRRLPAEASKIADLGVSAGKLTTAEIASIKSEARGRIAADRASLGTLKATGSASSLMGSADAFLSYDMPAKAEEFYTAALAKPDVDKDRANMRLGIAQSDQGKYAAAAQSFAKVSGVRAPVAKLWTAYAKQKAGSGAAAPVSAAAATQ